MKTKKEIRQMIKAIKEDSRYPYNPIIPADGSNVVDVKREMVGQVRALRWVLEK